VGKPSLFPSDELSDKVVVERMDEEVETKPLISIQERLLKYLQRRRSNVATNASDSSEWEKEVEERRSHKDFHAPY